MEPRIEYFKPSMALSPFVKQYFLFEGPNTHLTNMVPAWQKSLLGIQFGEGIQAKFESDFDTVNYASLNGYTTKPYLLKAQGDIVRFFVIEFSPVGMYLLFRENQEQFVNSSINAFDVLPARKHMKLSEAISEVDDMGRKVKVVEDFLKQLIPDVHEFYHIRPVIHCLQKMNSSQGNKSVNAINKELQFSERHLRRVFKQVTGISPKQYARILRFEKSFNHVMDGVSSFKELITDEDYFDQSHFIKEFKSFTGFTPQSLPKDAFGFARLFT